MPGLPDDQMLTMAEAAAWLRVSVMTLHHWRTGSRKRPKLVVDYVKRGKWVAAIRGDKLRAYLKSIGRDDLLAHLDAN